MIVFIVPQEHLACIHRRLRSLPRNGGSRWSRLRVKDGAGRPWLQLNWQPEQRIVHAISDPATNRGRTVYFGHLDGAGRFHLKRRCAGLAEVFQRLAA